MNKYHSILGVFLYLVVQPSIADLLVTNIGDNGKKSVVKLSNELGKVIDQSEPNQYMMIDMKNNKFYMVDNTEKMIVNLGDMSDMSDLSAMMPHEGMEQSKHNVEIVKIGAGPKIIGYKTTHYKLIVNNQTCSEHFISKGPLEHKEIKAFSQSMREQVKSRMPMGFNRSPCETAEDYFDQQVFDYGIPLLSKDVNGKENFRITEIKTDVSFSADEFQLPKNFSMFSQKELMRREMRRSMSGGKGAGGDDHPGAMTFDMPDMDPENMATPSFSEEDMEKMQEQMQNKLQQLQEMMQEHKANKMD